MRGGKRGRKASFPSLVSKLIMMEKEKKLWEIRYKGKMVTMLITLSFFSFSTQPNVWREYLSFFPFSIKQNNI